MKKLLIWDQPRESLTQVFCKEKLFFRKRLFHVFHLQDREGFSESIYFSSANDLVS